jgi:hypothetical protein
MTTLRARLHRASPSLVGGLILLAISGCSGRLIETSYGRSRGASVNGTGVVANLFRAAGHEVRTAVRLTDELDDWADVVVRFASRPGPPARDEADYYGHWLSNRRGRRLIYIPRDYDAEVDYWNAVLDQLVRAKDASAEQTSRARKLRDDARGWVADLPTVAKEVAPPEDWFAVEAPKPNSAVVCKTLGGPWARGIDPLKAVMPRHETFKVESETVLLTGDGRPLAIEWTRFNDSRVLVVAGGAFLLNAGLVVAERRPLAMRVVDWAGESPRNVAFVEGSSVVGDAPGSTSVFKLLGVPPFGWVAAQMLALGLAACLARAPRLGRARPEPPTGEDRPVAHPEALGALLARTGQADQARSILDDYRRWRSGTSGRPDRPSH